MSLVWFDSDLGDSVPQWSPVCRCWELVSPRSPPELSGQPVKTWPSPIREWAMLWTWGRSWTWGLVRSWTNSSDDPHGSPTWAIGCWVVEPNVRFVCKYVHLALTSQPIIFSFVRSFHSYFPGAAFTRFQTLRLQKIFPEVLAEQLISYGSCQFPTLGFVVERFKAIQAFVPEIFHKIKGKSGGVVYGMEPKGLGITRGTMEHQWQMALIKCVMF